MAALELLDKILKINDRTRINISIMVGMLDWDKCRERSDASIVRVDVNRLLNG